MRKVLILGAAGRDFHVFNTCFRGDGAARVVAFTAAQIPDIDGRVYPPELAGEGYPAGIPIVPEQDLEQWIRREDVAEVIFAYSDVSHEAVMHLASRALAAGADFRLLGPKSTMLAARRPVVAVCAVRTGAGKSQVSRRVAALLRQLGLRVAVVRHPMPYGDLRRQVCQRFATLQDLEAAQCTLEEREEYEPHLAAGQVVFAGVDYAQVLQAAQAEADVLLWDGGNNDFPFFRPDLLLVVVDPLRPGHERRYHPGEANLHMADVVIINKVDSADPAAVKALEASVREANPRAAVLFTASPPRLAAQASLAGRRVVVVEDGPTLTHGGMAYGAGWLAAQAAGAVIVDPWPWARGRLAAVRQAHPHLQQVLPALGYRPEQLAELTAVLNAVPCEAVVSATPIDLARLLPLRKPVWQVSYELEERRGPALADILAAAVRRWQGEKDG